MKISKQSIIKILLISLTLFACSSKPTEEVSDIEPPAKLVETFDAFNYTSLNVEGNYNNNSAIRIDDIDDIPALAINYDSFTIYDANNTVVTTPLQPDSQYQIVFNGATNQVSVWIIYQASNFEYKNEYDTSFAVSPYENSLLVNNLGIDYLDEGQLISDKGIYHEIKINQKVNSDDQQEEPFGTYYCDSTYVKVQDKDERLLFIFDKSITWTTYYAEFGPPYFDFGSYEKISDEIYRFIHYPIDQNDYFVIRDNVLYYPIPKDLDIETINNTTFKNGCYLTKDSIDPYKEPSEAPIYLTAEQLIH